MISEKDTMLKVTGDALWGSAWERALVLLLPSRLQSSAAKVVEPAETRLALCTTSITVLIEPN